MIERDADALGGTTKQASRAEIVRYARHHYEEITREAGDWMSTIGHALDAYEHEPELRAQLAEAQQEFINLKKGEQAASDRAERALLGEATREDCEDTFALDVQELFKRAEAAEQQLAEARENSATFADALSAAEQQRAALQRQLDAADKAIGFPHPDGLGRVEMIQLALAERDALLGRLAQIEQEMREHSVSYESQAEGRDAEDFEFLMDLSGLVTKWADTLRDLRVRSTPRQEPTTLEVLTKLREMGYLGIDPVDALKKCQGASEGASGDE